MGDAFIVRRGGSAGLSKCSIVVHTLTGSTVGAYSNPAATTLVKAGKEIGTSGDFIITGLAAGTYYVKATKGSQIAISGALAVDGITDVVMGYSLILYDAGTFHSDLYDLGELHHISNTYGSYEWVNSGGKLHQGVTASGANAGQTWDGFDNPIDFGAYPWLSTLHVTALWSSGAAADVSINLANATSSHAATKGFTYEQTVTVDIPLATYRSSPYYIVFHTNSGGGSGNQGNLYVSKIWMT